MPNGKETPKAGTWEPGPPKAVPLNTDSHPRSLALLLHEKTVGLGASQGRRIPQ